MTRQLRIEYEGAYYHVLSCGNHQQAIFLSDHDRNTFLKTLARPSEQLRGGHYRLRVDGQPLSPAATNPLSESLDIPVHQKFVDDRDLGEIINTASAVLKIDVQ